MPQGDSRQWLRDNARILKEAQAQDAERGGTDPYREAQRQVNIDKITKRLLELS